MPRACALTAPLPLPSPLKGEGIKGRGRELESGIYNRLVVVSSEIGRGHPSYLDSVMLALSRLTSGQSDQTAKRLTVAGLSSGVSSLAWKAVRAAYYFGGLGGPATWLYNRLRSPDTRPSRLQLSILGSGLRRRFTGYEGIVMVDHPLLAHILAGVCRVAYVHGEIAAPCFCAVPSVWRTFVPLESTAARLAAWGMRREALGVCGLFIEPQLVEQAEPAYAARIQRLDPSSDTRLTVGFFTSGAHPRPHLRHIILAAASVARVGHNAIVFWGLGWLRAAKAQLLLQRLALPDGSVRPVWARTRQDETTRTAELFPQLDVLVAAAHERTNWAVGLGLPMFALLPHIGPFARENFEFAQQQGVCLPLVSADDAAALGSSLGALRRYGRLAEMARAGWRRYPITGAERAARSLLESIALDQPGLSKAESVVD